jgi:hypothetical protein
LALDYSFDQPSEFPLRLIASVLYTTSEMGFRRGSMDAVMVSSVDTSGGVRWCDFVDIAREGVTIPTAPDGAQRPRLIFGLLGRAPE